LPAWRGLILSIGANVDAGAATTALGTCIMIERASQA
jgi:hypothetical protein